MINDFLNCFPNHTIATLDDKTSRSATPYRDKAKPGLVSSQTKRVWTEDELRKLNKKEAGIFFAYNDFGEDGTQRNKENVKKINAWGMEIDNIPKEEQWKKIINSPLNPSIIVETRNSYHCYWLASKATIENAKIILQGLIQYFDSDPAMKNIAVLLRVPGFNHNKNEPYPVKTVMLEPEVKYTDEEMLEAFPYTAPRPKPKKWKLSDTGDFWTAVNRMPTQIVLERLSGDSLVAGETFSFRERRGGTLYIDVNGSPSNAWIDEHDKIGSGSGGGPSIVNWLTYYGNDFKEIAVWVKENCKDLLPANVLEEKKTWSIEKSKKPVEKDFIPYTWGTKSTDKKVWGLKREEVVCLAGVTNSGKTAYAYFLARKNAELGHKVCYVVLEMTADAIADRVAGEAANYTIEEDRLEQFPEKKRAIYEARKKELLSLENLTMLDVDRIPIEEVYGEVEALGDYDLIVIDNFDRIAPTDGYSGIAAAEHKINTILDFTKKRNIPQILVHHINNKRGAKGGHTLADLRGTGKVADECNTVLFVSRDCSDQSEDEDTIKFEENRAKFFIQANKHRRKGQFITRCLYFHEADFYDKYQGPVSEEEQREKPSWEDKAFWQNK